MKNSIFGIIFGLALALPLALMAGTAPLALDSEFDGAALRIAACTILVMWPYLSALCKRKRSAPHWSTFKPRLLAGLILLPPAAALIMLGLAKTGGGFGAPVIASFLNLLGSGAIILGLFAAALAFTLK